MIAASSPRRAQSLALAVPLVLLYEGSIWSVRLVREEGTADKAREAAKAQIRRNDGATRGGRAAITLPRFSLSRLPPCDIKWIATIRMSSTGRWRGADWRTKPATSSSGMSTGGAIRKAEAALARRNAVTKEIGAARREQWTGAAEKLLAEVAQLKIDIPTLEAEEGSLGCARRGALANSQPAARRRARRQGAG